MLPATVSLSVGVVDPIPMFPLARIFIYEIPDEEATLNGLSAVDVEDCTLKAYEDDVALIPANDPLSRSVDVPRVVAVNQRVAKPIAPPVIEVAELVTHLVLVPVDCRIIPDVPVALEES